MINIKKIIFLVFLIAGVLLLSLLSLKFTSASAQEDHTGCKKICQDWKTVCKKWEPVCEKEDYICLKYDKKGKCTKWSDYKVCVKYGWKCTKEEKKCIKWEWDCPIPTVTNSPTPIPTIVEPTVTSVPPTDEQCRQATGHECSWSPDVNYNPSYQPSVCTVALPAKPSFTYKRVSSDAVQVNWNENDTNTTHWAITYGYEKDNLPYGIPYLSKEVNQVTIFGLNPGATLWVQLWRFNGKDCATLSDRIDP